MLYYSPEIITGQKYYGPEVDCWCLGITLFRMTAGFEPFSHAHSKYSITFNKTVLILFLVAVGELKRDVCKCNFPMPESLSPELQATIRKCLQVDRRKRMTLRQVLKDDPWLTCNGKLPCPVSCSPKTVFEEAMVIDDEKENRDDKTRTQFMKDLERDSQNPKVKRTVIYHPINPSTYYTTKAGSPQSMTNSEQQIKNLEQFRSELLQLIQSRADRLGIKSAERWGGHLKFLFSSSHPQPTKKKGISELVQRIAKDQVYHFQINNHQLKNHSASSRPPSLSFSISSSSVCSSIIADDSALATMEDEFQRKSSRDVMTLLKQTCQLMGITYVQNSPVSLQCVLTLRNAPKKSNATHTGSSATLNQRPKQSRRTSQTSSVGTSVVGGDETSTRQYKRLSLPLISHLTSSMTTSFFGRSKPRHSMDESTTMKQPQQQMNYKKQKEGMAMFTIEIENHKKKTDKVSLRFSKQQGSGTVFKMAGGWVAGVMALDGKKGSQ
jgi:hypothetical protein